VKQVFTFFPMDAVYEAFSEILIPITSPFRYSCWRVPGHTKCMSSMNLK